MTEEDWRAAGDRIDALIAASAAGGVAARERAEELVRLVVDLYGAGLERMLQLLHEQVQLTDEALDALANDDLVASLLLLYGLHPEDFTTRVQRAIDAIPYVELVGISDGNIRLKAMPGGHVSREAVEQAIYAAAPETERVDIEGLETDASFVPVEALLRA